MKIKGLVEYDISNYYKPSMFIIFPYCTFKCDRECGRAVCQNSALIQEEIKNIKPKDLMERYVNNPLTKAIVCGGLEPLDSLQDLSNFIELARLFTDDDIVIYTGYTEEESAEIIKELIPLANNLIIKFGRFIPDQESHYDEVLGVNLASPNQYARRIS